MRFSTIVTWPLCLALLAGPARAADGAAGGFADLVAFSHAVKPDITYAVASNLELKLDLYQPRGPRGKVPVVVYFHGGGWVDGSRQAASLMLMPFLAQGWAVVNVDYRLARTAPAPAAVEDARCALQWVHRVADEYGFDRRAVVAAGDSAGGHLALLAAMLPPDSPLDRACPASAAVRWSGLARPAAPVAAVVNWFGVTDVAALLDGLDARHFAVEWFGSNETRSRLATELSPLSHVRAATPPVITVHGDQDPVVPYRQASSLHALLAQAGVANELVPVKGGNHGVFTPAQVTHAWERIRRFLEGQGIRARAGAPGAH